MQRSSRATTLRTLAGLTLVLLLAAPFVVAASHDDHESERCPICKLSQTPAIGVMEPAKGLPPAPSGSLVSSSVLVGMQRGAFLPLVPRGPPA